MWLNLKFEEYVKFFNTIVINVVSCMYSISQCVSLVDQYADEIIQALVNGLSPDQVCTTIKLCTSVSKVSSPKVG